MAVPPCFHLADVVFPRVRAEAARRLVADGLSQSRVAGLLHVSQAMVSKYAHRSDAEDDPLVLRLVQELVAGLETPKGARHGPSPWCTTLSVTGDRPGGDDALADLLAAERLLLEANPLVLMPEVGLNLARCLPGAQDAADVLAYPARIVAAGDRLVRPVPPAFGASNHLAACLLALRRNDPGLTAIANVRGGRDVADAARPDVELRGGGPREVAFARAVGDAAPHLVHDPGAVGIEPCLYVAGASAVDVARRILSIASKVNP